jgi:Tfp pilus assembly protein PilN
MISINFASGNYRLLSRISVALKAGIILLSIVLAGLIGTAVSLRADLSALDATVKRLEAADEQARPLLLERARIAKDLSAMSGLMDTRSFSWTRLLTSLEAVVPVGVALNQLVFNPKDHNLTLEGRAQSPEALRNLIVGLEKTSSFRDPLLKHQSIDKGNISFNVVAIYNEGNVAVAARGDQ